MNYERIYDEIVSYFRENPCVNGERHHITPRSLGGSNIDDNLVMLSLRAHYVCHVLLVKMHKGEAKSKMVYALWMMSNQSKRRITSIQYENARKQFSAQQSSKQKKRSLEKIKNGTHNLLGGEQQRSVNKKRIDSGLHNFLGDKNPSHKRVLDGTHNFLDKEAAKKRNKKLVNQGLHVFQNKSEEHITKIAIANSKPICQVDLKTGKILNEFASAVDAQKQTGIAKCHIRDVVRGIRNKAGGFGWIDASEDVCPR